MSLLCKKCYKKYWRKNNKEHILDYDKKWRENHKEERHNYSVNWERIHKEERKRAARRYYREMKKDPIRSFKDSIRHHIKNSITRRTSLSFRKEKTTEDILGCSIEFFMDYISKKFQPGMTWNNYGKWHLDHIKPLASASTKEEVYQLCHYTNYQPLWAKDNLQKGSKMMT